MYPAPHLNELLKRVLPVVGNSSPAVALKATRLPYLTCENPGDAFSREDAAAMGIFGDDGLVNTPFDMFRFCIDVKSKGYLMGFIERRTKILNVVAFHRRHKIGQVAKSFFAAKFSKAPDDGEGLISVDGKVYDRESLGDMTDYLFNKNPVPPVDHGECLKIKESGDRKMMNKKLVELTRHSSTLKLQADLVQESHDFVEDFMEVIQKACVKGAETGLGAGRDNIINNRAMIFRMVYAIIEVMCYEYLAPHNFTARVTPEGKGRSVEWLQAREHYTLVHRHHPANNEGIREGQAVDAHKNMTRIAHTRRAHTRLLRSPKFKNKMGLRVFVRATWVGPRQWRDSAGQIYHVCLDKKPAYVLPKIVAPTPAPAPSASPPQATARETVRPFEYAVY